MSEAFAGEAVFAVAEGLEVTPVPDGTMIYQSAADRVHYLNPTAAIIFELCGMGKSVAEMEGFIADSFGLPEPPAGQVAECLTSLTEQGLILPRA